MATSLIAGALLAWSQMVCFEGALAKAEPKTMRYRVLHVAAFLAHRSRGLTLRLDETWPWADRSLRSLRQTAGSHPLTSRVTTPDPKADLQGVTSEPE